MKHVTAREPVYESLHALNHDFEGVLAELARLHEFGMFNQDLTNILRGFVKETRAWANFELLQILLLREQDDLARFRRLRKRWLKKLQDPNDVPIKAKRLPKKGQKASGKKGQRKGGEAEDEFEQARR